MPAGKLKAESVAGRRVMIATATAQFEREVACAKGPVRAPRDDGSGAAKTRSAEG